MAILAMIISRARCPCHTGIRTPGNFTILCAYVTMTNLTKFRWYANSQASIGLGGICKGREWQTLKLHDANVS
jgi:hypothetical protein